MEAIEKTGRKTLVMTGTLTSVCLVFPAISAVEGGYKVFAVVDASGNWSKMATDLAIARMAQAGVVPMDTFAAVAELQQTWNRPEGSKFAELFGDHLIPTYKCLMESYQKAQSVQGDGMETKMDKFK